MEPTVLTYANRTGRPSGRILRIGSVLVPGIGRVQRQVAPYAAAWHAHNWEALARPGRRWIVLGDSMSQAIGATAWNAGWVDQLMARLDPAVRPTVINLSASGARVRDVLDQQLPAYASLPPADVQPDLVTVLIGSNDLFGRREHSELLPSAFAELLTELTGGLPRPADVVVSTLPQPRDAAAQANAHIARAGATGSVRVVDMARSGPASWSGKLASDHFHPNDAGYAGIANAFEPAVRRALTSAP